jgi:two-component system, OmpR family, sensor kinase
VKPRSFVSRVTRGMTLVAALSALLLAGAAAVTALVLWQANERRSLAAAAEAMSAAIEREGQEEKHPLSQAISEAIRESALGGYRAEVWQGADLVASNWPGPPLTPAAAAGDDDWAVHTRPLPSGFVLLVAAHKEHRQRALGVFIFSIAFAAPICFPAAWFLGRTVARRATRPLEDLQARLATLHGLEPLPPSPLRDVPAEVQGLEDAFRALWSQLDQTLRRELEFAANASHELRTPLARIRLHAEHALNGTPPTARAALHAQVTEIDRLVRLVDSLLILARDVSRAEPWGEAVNLADVCRRVAGRLPLQPRPITDLFPDEVVVRGDEELLEITVENLLDNARKFAVGQEPIRVRLTEAAAAARLEVITPGARIPKGEQERLFERFYRSAHARAGQHGHGLGLSLARHIARLHAGDLTCCSAPTEDACFRLELPSWTPEPRSADAPHVGESPNGR